MLQSNFQDKNNKIKTFKIVDILLEAELKSKTLQKVITIRTLNYAFYIV